MVCEGSIVRALRFPTSAWLELDRLMSTSAVAIWRVNKSASVVIILLMQFGQVIRGHRNYLIHVKPSREGLLVDKKPVGAGSCALCAALLKLRFKVGDIKNLVAAASWL